MSGSLKCIDIFKYDNLVLFLTAVSLKWFFPWTYILKDWTCHEKTMQTLHIEMHRHKDWSEGFSLHAALLQQLKTCIIREVIRHKPLYQIVHLICLILVYHLMNARAVYIQSLLNSDYPRYEVWSFEGK